MVALKAGEVDGFLRRFGSSETGYPIVLVYGPDIGLVNERADFLVRKAAGSGNDPLDDPFRIVRIDGDVLASDPARLVDEATTVGLFGGKRIIWVKASGRNIAPSVETLLNAPSLDNTTVVIEGGDLARNAPLRSLCEKSRRAAAVPCYADGERDLGAVVDETFRQEGFALTREVRQAIIASLGGDRLASRGELAKLLLYVHGRNEVTLDDVEAVLADVSGLAMDAIIDAVFSGHPAPFENDYRRLTAAGVPSATILGGALRHALNLLQVRIDIESGTPLGVAVDGWRGLHFKRKPHIERQLNRWSSSGLKTAIQNLQTGLLETRRFAALANEICGRVLLSLAIRRG